MTGGDTERREMLRLLVGPWIGKAVAAAAELGIADGLADGPRTGAELAAELRVRQQPLERLLRLLAAVGLVDDDAGRFRLTATGELLSASHPASMREQALLYDSHYFREAWDRLADGVRTGEQPFVSAFGEDVFSFIAARPEEALRFSSGMAAGAGYAEALASAFDFSGVSKVADVGGGDGAVLEAVLSRHEHVIGVLVDLPASMEPARERLLPFIAEGRCSVVEGDFLERVPAADVHILSRILHNWDDDSARRILANCRAAMPAGDGRVLIAERVLPDSGHPWLSLAFDLHMMVMTGGAERTGSRYEAVLEQAGLRTVGESEMPLEMRLLEAAPVSGRNP